MIGYRLTLLSVLLQFFTAFVASKDAHKVYISATVCNISEKFFYKNFSCFAKSYSRTYSASFMYMVAKAPITEDFKVN